VAAPTRIVILGGGFAGVMAARRLERRFKRRDDVQVTLISRDNFLLMTPLMFESCTGTLELRHCSVAIRSFLRRTYFVEAVVRKIDLDQRLVHADWGAQGTGEEHNIPYDQLVLALGAVTNMHQVPGSENAFTFKTLADVIVLRNHIIECLERADVVTDAEHRRRLLTFAVVGGGFVGAEVFGEVSAFMDEVIHYYPGIQRDEIRLFLVHAGDRIMPEVPPKLGDYGVRVLNRRKGVRILTHSPALSIEPGILHLKDQTIEAATIVLSAGISPSPLAADLPLPRDHHGNVIVEATMRCTARPEVWALGDCASVPGTDGKPCPKLAQYAMRQANTLADNIDAVLHGKPPRPFEYRTLGLMAALGHERGLATVMRFQLRGFFAWWIRRTYYLMVMPRWPQRLRIVADWTIALFFRPEISKVDLRPEQVARADQTQ